MFYCELLSGIWIGDIDILSNKKFIEDNDITILMNCTQLFEFPEIDTLRKIRLPFSPIQSNENIMLLKKNYHKIIDFIHNSTDTNNILICCYDGKSISAFIIALYILKYSTIDRSSIYNILLSKQSDLSLWCDLELFN
jgi:protein-tyrosine phosphatase